MQLILETVQLPVPYVTLFIARRQAPRRPQLSCPFRHQQ